MNNNYVKLLNNLQNLKLEQIKDNLDKYLDLINENKKDIIDSLYELTALEINLKQEKAMNACVRVANFPFLKTLNEFDFSFQPSINKDKILDFQNLRFIENNENIAIYTNPDLIFLKEEPRIWFKKIIGHGELSKVPQKFINYLMQKEVIEEF